MEGNNFWLIYIQENQVSVSLTSSSLGKFQVLSLGPKKDWNSADSESLISAIDESLSVASLNANITEDQEPARAAFVVPPFWVGSDGKILPQKLKFIKESCKKLSFTPTGFLAEDEAIVEDSNQSDGFPSSFILVHLSEQEFYLSLVYLGHIKERVRKAFMGPFDGQILESALLEIKTESTLPPQIILFGQTDNSLINSLKDYPWIGKKNIETFLHLPDISLYSDNDLITTFTRVISSQLSGNLIQPNKSENNETEEPDQDIHPENPPQDITPEDQLPSPLNSEAELVETTPADFGFTSVSTPKTEETPNPPIIDQIPEPNLDPFEPPVILPPTMPQASNKKKLSFNFFKKIKLPKPRLNFNFFWIILIILPFLALLPFIFSSANVTLFVNPYKFEKTLPVTLKVDSSVADIASSIIPVEKNTFDVEAKTSVDTTGQKTIGEKAKGEIIIYNKLSQSQTIPKGSILTDSSGKKFELTTAVSVASSSSDLDQGIITLGQTKTVAMASDIGSEFNISADSQLTFKDFPQTSLIAKVETDFSGGSRQQIKAVSQADKTEIQSKIKDEVAKVVEDKINQTLGDISGIIKETIQSNQGNLDLSREVGEAADQLSGTITASVSVFTLSSSVKEAVLKQFLSGESDFDKINFNPDDFSLTFKIDKTTATQATGSLTITGKALPKIDTGLLQKSLSIKTVNQAKEVIRKILPRAYNFNIGTNLPLLPFNPNNINIEVKIENL